MSTTSAASRVCAFADEILQDSIFSLGLPISHSGLSLVPICPMKESVMSEEFINAAVVFEIYRRPQAFQKRTGYLESLTVELFNVNMPPLEGEAAWSSALQLLLKMREIDDDSVASKDDSESAMIGLDELRGEVVLASGSESILYCSLSL